MHTRTFFCEYGLAYQQVTCTPCSGDFIVQLKVLSSDVGEGIVHYSIEALHRLIGYFIFALVQTAIVIAVIFI